MHNLDSRVGLWNEEKRDDNTVKQDDDNKENKSIQNVHEVEQAVRQQLIYTFD